MGQFVRLDTEGMLNRTIAGFLSRLLKEKAIEAVLIPSRQPYKKAVMQTLISQAQSLGEIDPFAPVVPTSSAKILSSLTHRPLSKPVAAVLRSCEIRAFIELVKLHQGTMDNLYLIGMDCLGRYESKEYLTLAEREKDLTERFLQGGADLPEVTRACRVCEHPVPRGADLTLCVLGADVRQEIWIEEHSDKGQALLVAAGLTAGPDGPKGRQRAIEALEKERFSYRDGLFSEVTAATSDLEGLSRTVSSCVNCYNCRVACPVCYCRECVFGTETFRHDSDQFLRWLDKRGHLRMPTDTLFYHLTRMVHMSTLCVGCGQCSSACPNDIPVMELLRTTAQRTQARFDYVPGRSLDEAQPLATFQSDELVEVTGQVK